MLYICPANRISNKIMEKKSTFAGITIFDGLIGAVILFVLNVLYYILGVNFMSIGFSIISFLITFGTVIVLMVMGMKSYRDNVLDGKINYGQKLLAGLVISLVAILVSGFFNFVFFQLVDPAFMSRQMEEFIYQWEDKLPPEQLDAMRDRMSTFKSPLSQWVQSLKFMPIVSIVLSLIVAAFVKKDTTTDNIAV